MNYGKYWGVIGWQFGFACRNGDGRLSAELPRKHSKYNQCANRTYRSYRSYLPAACVQIERIMPQGMQCVPPSIDACLVIPQKTSPQAKQPPHAYRCKYPAPGRTGCRSVSPPPAKSPRVKQQKKAPSGSGRRVSI